MTLEEILANAQPMEVKRIVNNSPGLPKVKFKDDNVSDSVPDDAQGEMD